MHALGRFKGITIEWRYLDDVVLDRDDLNWLENYSPDVVVGFPASIYTLLGNVGYEMPRDFAFVAINRTNSSLELENVNGSCIADIESNLADGVSMLNTMIRAGQRGQLKRPMELVVEPQWHEGTTLPRLNH